MNIFNDPFNTNKLKTLSSELEEMKGQFSSLKVKNEQLQASNSRLSRTRKIAQQRTLSEITQRDPIATYSFYDTDIDGIPIAGHKTLVETTVAKRILSIKPQYAMAEQPIIADVNKDGEIQLDTPFTRSVMRIMQSRRGMSTTSPNLFNGNFGGFEMITRADIQSYGRYGAIYFIFEDDNEYKTDVSNVKGRRLLGMCPLDESEITYNVSTDNPLEIKSYDIKMRTGWHRGVVSLSGVHPSRVVLITDNHKFEHTPRLINIDYEVRNMHDLGLSLMASIAISRPKIASALDAELVGDAVNRGYNQETILDVQREMMQAVIECDDNVITAIAATLPEFIQPKFIQTYEALKSQATSASMKEGIPSRLLLGSERGELASTQDDDNWQDVVKQYRTYHTAKIIRDCVSVTINAGVVEQPMNKDTLEFEIFWAEDKSEIIKTNTAHIATINDILINGVGLKETTKTNLISLADKLASEMQ